MDHTIYILLSFIALIALGVIIIADVAPWLSTIMLLISCMSGTPAIIHWVETYDNIDSKQDMTS